MANSYWYLVANLPLPLIRLSIYIYIWELLKNATWCLEQNISVTVFTPYLTNHPSKRNKISGTPLEK